PPGRGRALRAPCRRSRQRWCSSFLPSVFPTERLGPRDRPENGAFHYPSVGNPKARCGMGLMRCDAPAPTIHLESRSRRKGMAFQGTHERRLSSVRYQQTGWSPVAVVVIMLLGVAVAFLTALGIWAAAAAQSARDDAHAAAAGTQSVANADMS